MLKPSDFGTQEECVNDETKHTLPEWYEILIADVSGGHVFWERAEEWSEGKDIDLGSLPANEQYNLWRDWTDGIICAK